jgi:hypothetical protein
VVALLIQGLCAASVRGKYKSKEKLTNSGVYRVKIRLRLIRLGEKRKQTSVSLKTTKSYARSLAS